MRVARRSKSGGKKEKVKVRKREKEGESGESSFRVSHSLTE